MKNLSKFTNVIGVVVMVWALAGCGTTSSNSSSIATSQKEMLLTQAGFKTKTVTTPKQKERVEQLAVGVVSAVKYQGTLYYVFPAAKKDQIFVGKQPQFDSYKKMLAAKTTTSQTDAARHAEIQKEAQQDMSGPILSGETAGPNRISVQVFDGFGPMWDTGPGSGN